MQTHNLKRAHPNKKTRQVGRGGTRGKTAGRGTKGQNARAGHKKRPEIRDFIKRVPKLRGRGKNINTSIELKSMVVNIGSLNEVFKDGDIVSPRTLVKKGIIKTISRDLPRVKILGGGKLDKSLTIKECQVSTSAKLAIEKAGGKCMV
ncbi:MAG: 50S ribosomal protein L15 [Candidatus Zambryskibacteria bacterium]|nr:50S ribosomal protein L15 [Candidatus Zambryskibacteria bacterium]